MSHTPLNSESLRSKYHLGSLYLTYIPLNDLRHLLNDEGKVSQVKEVASQPATVDTLRTFLNQLPSGSMNDGIAFLQLDLNTLAAGFKKISDLDGVIHTISWAKRDVEGIAEICDLYFTRNATFIEVHQSARGFETPLVNVWSKIHEIKDDPFITKSKMADLLGVFRELVEVRPREVEALKLTNVTAHVAIKTFKNEYDTYVANQLYVGKLSQLWSERAKIEDRLEGIYTGKLRIDSLLKDKVVSTELKKSAGVFEGLGFLSNLETSDNEELFHINECLLYPTKTLDRLKVDTSDRLTPGISGIDFGKPSRGFNRLK